MPAPHQSLSVQSSPATVSVPAAPLLAVGLKGAVWVDGDGSAAELAHTDAAERARGRAPVVCHARATARRLGIQPFMAFDVLELYAFVRPARFCVPTIRGLAMALGLTPPDTLLDAASLLRAVAARLLAELAARDPSRDPDAPAIARVMESAGWPWAPVVLRALGTDALADLDYGGLDVWRRLPAWSDRAPPPPPAQEPVSAAEARTRLAELVGPNAEDRPQQADYASAVSQAFAAREVSGEPHVVLAEAGTGVGKTLGYLAPASVWAEKNRGPVWISTFTRNLQHQIDSELDRLYPNPGEKTARVVIRKGRENYLCLLNLEEAARAVSARPGEGVAMGLMARWAARTRDGDMVGGDFPGWLADLIGRGRSLGLTDRRGECIYSACPHYTKCFIERGVRRARHARIVVANHALAMVQAAHGDGDDAQRPTRYVFDEGHQIFAAADNAFAAHLSGQETHALRRWLLGGEGRSGAGAAGGGRARGLRRRTDDLVAGDEELETLLDETAHAARALPSDGWLRRVGDDAPKGPAEEFLAAVRAQVRARTEGEGGAYSLEADTQPASEKLCSAGLELAGALDRLRAPLARFRARLMRRLEERADSLDSETRRRIDATCRGIERRGTMQLGAWIGMLETLQGETPPEFVDWIGIERQDGRDTDVGMFRHWIDPTEPFAEVLLVPAHGVVITSATLTDGGGDSEADWAAAEARTGCVHLPKAALRARVLSPFDYGAQTRVFVVDDLERGNIGQLAAAYRALFAASGGGALGLFTAIARLRAVHARIGPELEAAGLSLYAQHVDPMDTSTLVDIFRAEENSCLLGTDAVRDGVDVPGRSLRLIVFDRVPWPRPDIPHRARRARFGGRAYDDRLTRLRLKQAFGRLVRRANDRGVFVLLDARMPSRLAGAFPAGVAIERLGLADAVARTRAFLTEAQNEDNDGGVD